jgi:hypothetical protein
MNVENKQKMKDIKILKLDKNLTKMAKNIFGVGIVDSAYITTYNYGNSSKVEIEERLGGDMYKLVKEEINFDSKNIVIKFTNSKMVYFTNSEWGSISNIT